MKKLSLFLSAMLISMMSFAGTVTFEAANDIADVSTAAELTMTKDGVSLYASKAILGNGQNYRLYKGQWIEVSSEYGNITSIEFTCLGEGTNQYGPANLEYRGTAGSYTYAGVLGTWSGDEEKVTIYVNQNNQVRVTKIVITYESADANFVDQPMIAGDVNFADTANVVITADEGMKIYYTLDGTDPTTASTEYTAPFEVYATTTVKAIAYNVATATSSMVTTTVFTQATKVPCAEAAAIAKALSDSKETTELYYSVKGYVTSIKDTFNTSTGRQQFWIADTKTGGEVLYSYNNQVPCAMEVGMKVRIVGRLKQWDTGQKIQPQIVNAEITILAPAPKVYTVSASAENGTVEGAGQYEEGTQATLTATAAEGYEFVNWTIEGTEVSTENPYTFAVTADLALVANFKLIPPTKYNVTVTADSTMGTVAGAGEYEEGAEATLTATANEGYEFVNWTVDGTEVSTENPYTFNVTADVEVVANFKEVDPTTGVENTLMAEQPVKIVRNGQVFILKGNKMFNVIGQQVK